MRAKRRRLHAVLAGMIALAGAAALILTALEDNIVFFRTPTEVATGDAPVDRRFRIGGIVVEDSVIRRADGLTVEFRVTDLAHTLPVAYRGILPDLFREGQGVVAEGALDAGGVFRARRLLAKHDETYMPPEVAEALKRSGRWQGAAER